MKTKENKSKNYRYENIYETNTKKNKNITTKKVSEISSVKNTVNKEEIRIKALEKEILDTNQKILDNKRIISKCERCAFLIRQEYQIAKKVKEEYINKNDLWHQMSTPGAYISSINKKQLEIYDRRLNEIRSFANVKTCKLHKINTIENMIDFKKVISLESALNKKKEQSS